MGVLEGNKLSIIMAVYNVAEYVEKSVLSVLGQKYRDIELILIDDGSTDGSGNICKRLADVDSRIKLFHMENQGVSAARNYGLNIATGDYITFVDSDDWVEFDAYEKMMNYLNKYHAEICVMGYTPEGNDSFTRTLKKDKKQILSKTKAVDKLIEGKLYTWSIGDKIYRRDLLVGIEFNKEIVNGEDLLFNWRVFRKADSVAYIPLHGYHYVQRVGSMTNSFSKKKFTVIHAFTKVLYDCRNDSDLYKKIEKKYIQNLLYLASDYCRDNNFVHWHYTVEELRNEQANLRKHWRNIINGDFELKIKAGAFLFMMPCIFLTVVVKIHDVLKVD